MFGAGAGNRSVRVGSGRAAAEDPVASGPPAGARGPFAGPALAPERGLAKVAATGPGQSSGG
eukprot:15448703-Alexandrium_andersonii.AAC.1